VEVLSLCPFRAGGLIWKAAPDAYSLTVIVKATLVIVPGGEAKLSPEQEPVMALGQVTSAGLEDLAPLKPRVDVIALRGHGDDDDDASIDVAGMLLTAQGPLSPLSPARRILVEDTAFAWATKVLAGSAKEVGAPPAGFDFGFFQAAPRVQQIDLLRVAAPLGFSRLLPNAPLVETRLPQQRPQAFRVDPKTGRVSEIVLRCDTLCVDVERGRLMLTFRGIADLKSGDPAAVGKIVIAAHEQGKRIRPERIDRFLKTGEAPGDDAGEARSLLEMRHDTVLVATSGDTVALPEMGVLPEIPAIVAEKTVPLPTDAKELGQAFLGLPFRPVDPVPLPGGTNVAKVEAVDEDTTVDLRKPLTKPVTPPKPLPTVKPKPAVMPAPLGPRFGKVGMGARPLSAPASDEAFDPARAMSIERCAEVAAEVRFRSERRAEILGKEKLSGDQWGQVERHWAESMSRETERGVRKLLSAYDAAYVATMERLGIRVGLAEHARLQVAAERGTTSTVLAELGLESADQMRLGRVWNKRLVEDPKLMGELAVAIEAERAL